jgi:hypothetical protein
MAEMRFMRRHNKEADRKAPTKRVCSVTAARETSAGPMMGDQST